MRLRAGRRRRHSHPDPARDEALALLRHALGHDGGTTRFIALAETLTRRGGRARLIAGPGPLEDRADRAGELLRVDWPGRGGVGLAQLERATATATATLVGCLPQNLPFVPALARRGHVHLCVHATPAALAGAFDGHLEMHALGRVLDDLHRSGRVLLTAASRLEAREHERVLGLTEYTLVELPHGVDPPPGEIDVRTGPIRRVALVSRLVDVKLPHAAAAAALVAAGRAAGHDVVLEVHGAGPAEAAARRIFESTLPTCAWRLRGPTNDPLGAMLGADVVVGGGRTCVEALSLGRRAVPARGVDLGDGSALELEVGEQLGAPVTAATLDLHVADNFRWSGRPPVPAAEAWRTLESISVEELAAVRDRAHAELSGDAALDRELGLLDALRRRPYDGDALLEAAGRCAAELGSPPAACRARRA